MYLLNTISHLQKRKRKKIPMATRSLQQYLKWNPPISTIFLPMRWYMLTSALLRERMSMVWTQKPQRLESKVGRIEIFGCPRNLEDPRAIPAPNPEDICPTHIACKKGICEDMSRLIKAGERKERQAEWEKKKKNKKGTFVVIFCSWFMVLTLIMNR
jgi:hypothetical protein